MADSPPWVDHAGFEGGAIVVVNRGLHCQVSKSPGSQPLGRGDQARVHRIEVVLLGDLQAAGSRKRSARAPGDLERLSRKTFPLGAPARARGLPGVSPIEGSPGRSRGTARRTTPA